MPIARIVSGGQTGSDRGGLDAALHCRIAHGGFCPKGRLAEDGTIPARYALTEMTSKNYLVRTEANVVDSDATVIFSYGDLEGGSLKTAEFARKHGRPWLHVDLSRLDRQQSVDAVVDWLKTKCPAKCVLNVAGSRESKAPGIAGVVKARLVDVISAVNGTCFYPIGDETDGTAEPTTPAVSTEEAARELRRRAASAELERRMGRQAASVLLRHPKTVAEAVRILLDVLPPKAKDDIRGMADKDEFGITCHFWMSLLVRNTMIHRNENSLDLYADFQKGCREGRWSGIADPDGVSGVIVGLVWDALHGGQG